jgi:hypothetical protein
MEHPLIGNLDDLTVDQLSEKVGELHKKMSIAQTTGNGNLVHQIRMALEAYNNKYLEKLNDSYQKQNPGNIDFDGKIKIE